MMSIITLCSSVSFYRQVIMVKIELESLGFTVLVPDLSSQMESENNYSFESYAERFDDANPQVKKRLMDEHFKKIAQSDGVLIINKRKHELEGYIGPNVLMEITVGYFLQKPVFLLHPVEKSLPAFDEVMALQPLIIYGELKQIVDYLK